MEGAYYSETSMGLYWTTRRYVPDDSTVHIYHCGNLKSIWLREMQKPTRVRTEEAQVKPRELEVTDRNVINRRFPTHCTLVIKLG
jgi:hypothetical protein